MPSSGGHDHAELLGLGSASAPSLWDVQMPGNVSALTAIDIAGGQVYVTQWGRLDAFDIAKGSHSFSIGR